MIRTGGVCVVDLIAKSPLEGQVPAPIGTISFQEVAFGPMALVAPFKGQGPAVSAALEAALGLPFPDANRDLRSGACRALWVAGGQALVIGPLPDLEGLAAVTDQSDAFAGLAISGAGVTDVLARLVPVDLRIASFGVGRTARTLVTYGGLGHAG